MLWKCSFPEKLHFTNITELENVRHDWEETHRSTCEVLWPPVLCTFSLTRRANRKAPYNISFCCYVNIYIYIYLCIPGTFTRNVASCKRKKNADANVTAVGLCSSGVPADGGRPHRNTQVYSVGPLQSFLHSVCQRRWGELSSHFTRAQLFPVCLILI